MKKNSIIAIILIAIVVTMCTEPPKVKIKTKYFDLPTEKQSKLKKIFKTEDLSTITDKNFQPLHEYLHSSLFGNKNPVNNSLETNYFWFIYNALPDFIDENERHKGYYKGEGKHSENQKLLAYSLYRIDRSSENINTIFDYFKPMIKNIIKPELYQNSGVERKVNSLIITYNAIIEIKNYKKLLTEAYAHADTATGRFVNIGGQKVFEKFNNAYGFTANELSEIICKHFELNRESTMFNSPDVSFWMRRNKEGNMETVYKILIEIEGIYSE